MSLNKFSNTYQPNLEPYFAKVSGTYESSNGTSCFSGLQANTISPNGLTITLNGTPNLITPIQHYGISDGTYVELFINEPFSSVLSGPAQTLSVQIEGIKEAIRPSDPDGTVYKTIIGSAGSNYGFSASSFSFSDNGSTLNISFLQNSQISGSPTVNLNLNLRLIYPL